MQACSRIDSRVMVIIDRKLGADQRRFLEKCQDCGGSLGHFENGRFVSHIRVGSKRLCRATATDDGVDGIELFFRHMAERTDMSEEDKFEILQLVQVCDNDGCAACSTCRRTSELAETYGFYDFVEWARTFSAL